MSNAVGGDLLDTADAGPAAVRGAGLRAGGYVLGSLVSLGSAALLFRHLGLEDGGRYVTVQSLVIVAAGIADLGLTVIGTREYAVLEGEARQTMLRDLLGLRIVLTILGMLGAVVFATLAGYGPAQVIGTAISGLAILLTALQHQLGIGLTAQLRLGWVSAADVLRQVVTAAAIVVAVVVGGSLVDFFWANVVGGVAAVGIIVSVARATIPLRPSFDRRRWRALLADTAAYSAATAISAIYFRLAMVLISLIASAKQTGYYGAAFRGVEVILAVPVLLVGAAFPIFARAARDDKARLAYAVGKLTDVLLICGAGVALGLGVGASFVIEVVAGDEFAPAADVLRIQGIGLLFSFVAAGVGFAALSLKRHAEVLRASLSALVVCAILVPILASTWNAVGAAVATTIAEAVLFVAMTRAMMSGGVALEVDRAGLLRTGAALAVGLLPALLTGLPDVGRAVLCLGTYALALVLFRALPPELREQLHLPG